MKKVFYCILVCLSMAACQSQKGSEMDRFVDGIMKKMTLEEKLGQLYLPTVPSEIVTGDVKCENVIEDIRAGRVGGILNAKSLDSKKEYQRLAVEESRLGIPLLIGLDVIHGYRTIFPVPIALGATWDEEMVETVARISATEASAEGICWTFNPMVDVCRDPRWGRCVEGTGEDAYLNGMMGAAMVRGYESQMMSCVKHFAIYGAAEGGRDYRETDMSESRMRNEYMPQYRMALDAGSSSIMTSFNDINGVPATINKWLFTDVLREEWGYDGLCVADYNAIGQLVNHGVGDVEEATALSFNAGLDMDMVTGGIIKYGEDLVKDGKISKARIDEACRRVLEAKYKLGLFDDPYKFFDEAKASKTLSDENMAVSKQVALESFVLLKNDGVLPLKKGCRVALVGPFADAGEQCGGSWAALDPKDHKSLKAVLEETEGVDVIYAKGSNVLDDADFEKLMDHKKGYKRDSRDANVMIAEAVSAASRADVVVAAVGELDNMTGEGMSRANIVIPDAQHRLLEALAKTGKPVVLVLFSGRPLVLEWEHRTFSGILEAWYGGSRMSEALADVLLGEANPSGKLTMSFPYAVGQIPVYYNMKPVGHPVDPGQYKKHASHYIDIPNEPLYPFGYGLSYTTYEYSDVVLGSSSLKAGGKVTAYVTVKNTGSMDGDEIVQLYIRDLVSSETRPIKELKGFKRVHIPAGESAKVEFEITPDMLSWYYVLQHKQLTEPGEFEIIIGSSSDSVSMATLKFE